MCGIAGRVSWDKPPDRERVAHMADRLRHRGPDARGLFAEGPAALGHQRLAVIDLRPGANQPMHSADGRFVIVYNGEIYNYRELRGELERGGVVFRTDSDTEVLLEAFGRWGTRCLERLNGMFAFAVWDRAEQRLVLARDRLGEKPLLYYPLPSGGVVFASELKGLLADPNVPRTLNPRALGQFLSHNYIVSPEAIVNGVRKLGPAEFLEVARGRPLQPARYWSLADHFHAKRAFKSIGEAAEALRALIDDAVRLRLVSDVPLGAFLSGGLDSSTIVASMAALGNPRLVRTFSVGFPEPGYSELAWARDVAGALGVDHRDETVTSDVADEIERIVQCADEPFADTSIVPMYRLARFARQHVTVCLSGDGADELFAGYDTYLADKLQRLTARLPRSLLAVGRRVVDGLLPVTRRKVSLDYKLRQFFKGAALAPAEAHASWRRILSGREGLAALAPEWMEAVARADSPGDIQSWAQDVAGCHYLDQAMYMDMKTWLADDILVKVDRATMAHSLESRAPFLDHRVVEFAASLPVEFKLRGFSKKYLLKKSQKRRLKPAVLGRAKSGFNAPVSHWIGGSLRGRLFDVLSSEKTKGMFNRPYVEGLLAEHDRYQADHGLKLFGIVCLGIWLQQH